MGITSLNIADGSVKRRRLPYIKKRTIVIVLIIIVIIIILGVLGYMGVFTKNKKTLDDNKKSTIPNPVKQLPPSVSSLHVFNKAAVCADGPPCAEIGRNILEKNGSAIDATIASLFCNGLINMQSMGLGGGFFMTIYVKDENKAYTLNAREASPFKASSNMFGNDNSKAQKGPLSIGVPGELRGYWAAHKRFGKLPWKDVLQPTIDLCESGWNMSLHQHDSVRANKDLTKDDTLKAWFTKPDGSLKSHSNNVQPQTLCDTLKIIADKGGDDLYNGTLAVKLLEDLKQMGSIITAEDLKNYTAIWEEPIQVKLRDGNQLHSMPLPGSGVLLAFILNILDGYNFNKTSIEDTESTVLTYHRIIEAFKFAYAKRTELGDLRFNNLTNLMKNLTSKDYANDIRLSIMDNGTSNDPTHYGAVYFNNYDHGTAHISVISEDGDAVSVTSTINYYFGSGLTSKQTGIILNNGMDDFSSDKFENHFGLRGSPNNAIAPGKRSLSSMTPSIITDKDGNVKMVIGASGGTKITTAIALVIMRTLWLGQDIKEAIDAPRIHHQISPMEVSYEYGILQQVIDGLEALGHNTSRYDERGSIICALMKLSNKIYANADHRKGGDVYGF